MSIEAARLKRHDEALDRKAEALVGRAVEQSRLFAETLIEIKVKRRGKLWRSFPDHPLVAAARMSGERALEAWGGVANFFHMHGAYKGEERAEATMMDISETLVELEGLG